MGIRNPRYRAWRRIIPWLRYGYTPDLVPWLKENAKRYDAIVVHGLRNYVALGLLAHARISPSLRIMRLFRGGRHSARRAMILKIAFSDHGPVYHDRSAGLGRG
jgi:hypothetical protein